MDCQTPMVVLKLRPDGRGRKRLCRTKLCLVLSLALSPPPPPHPASLPPFPSFPPSPSPSLPLCLPPSPSVSPYVPSPIFPERIFIWRYRDFTSLGSQSFPPSKPFPSDNVVKICTVSLMFLLHIVCKCSMYLKSMLKSAHKVRPT